MKRITSLITKVRRSVRRLVHKSPAKSVAHDQTNVAHAHGHHDIDRSKRNISRFFVEQRHITWVMLIGVCVWGVYSYKSMPQRKDPDTPVKTAVAITTWPGVNAEKIEQLVTRKIEEKVAQNANVEKIRSISRTNISVVYVDLDENFPGSQIGKEFDDIALKLDSIKDLPDGAGPIQFIKDFGDTSALMLTVASPKVSEAEIDLRAKEVGEAIARHRAQYAPAGGGTRFTIVNSLTHPVSPRVVQDPLNLFADYLKEKGVASDLHVITEPGFVGVDGVSDASDETLLGHTRQFINERLQAADFHPDSWPPVVIRDPQETRRKLGLVAGDKYSYREMDDFTDLIEKGLKSVPQATKVSRSGILSERIFLLYSQERIASYGLQPGDLPNILSARNITPAGGQLEAVGKNFSIDPSGEFKSEKEIGDVAITRTEQGAPVYLRDVVDVERGYDSPPRYLNFYDWRDANGKWQRSRAITVAVQMRPGGYIGQFGEDIDADAGRAEETVARRPDHGAHLRPAAAGHGERQPVHEQPLRGDHPGGDRLTDRLLGLAFGAADGVGDPDHALHHLRDVAHAGDRSAAGLHRHADHRSRPAGGRAGGRRRCDQEPAGGGSAAAHRRVAGADKAHHGDHLRHHHQHRRLPAVPDSARGHGRIFIQPAHRADLLFGGGADRGDDLHPLPRLLFVEAQTRTAPCRNGARKGSRPSITESANGRSITAGWCCSARSSSWRRRADRQPAQNRLFPERPFLPFIPRRVAAGRCAACRRPTKPRGTRRKWCAR